MDRTIRLFSQVGMNCLKRKQEFTLSQSFFNQLNKSFNGAFSIASESKKLTRDVITFPSLTLGDATHYWGVPRGAIAQFYGPEGGGKTFFAMLMAAQAQKQYPGSWVVWVDAEYAFDRRWAQQIGIDLNRLMIVENNNAAEIFTLLCGEANDKGGKSKPGVLDGIKAGQLDCKLIVLDSIANLISPVEQEMAGLARFLKKGMQRISGMLSETKTAMICINQAREKIGERIPTLTYPGGRAWRHTLSLAILFNPSRSKEGQIQTEDERKVGHKIIATVEKTRGGADKWKAEFWLDFSKGVVRRGEEAAILGDAYGFIRRPNNLMWEYEDLKIKGKDAFFAALEARPDLVDKLIEQIRALKESGGDISRPAALTEDSKADTSSSEMGEGDLDLEE
jgi:recombination protein RecA